MPLRAALTGSLHGPDLSRVMEIRGRDDVLACLRDAASRNGDPV
jgi:glutamyl/glutaminyl-tRNA synthetase